MGGVCATKAFAMLRRELGLLAPAHLDAVASVCLTLLLGACAAQAQTSVKLVSNTGQLDSFALTFDYDLAQAFTTGGIADGYKLTSVDIPIRRNSGTVPTYTVTIRSNSSGSPGTLLGTLTNPSPLGHGTNRFTAPGDGIDLAANTTYFMTIDVSGTGTAIVKPLQTAWTTEDPGGAAGWSIGNAMRHRLSTSSGMWSDSNRDSIKLAVHGYAKVPTITIAGTQPVTEGTAASFTVTSSRASIANLTVNLSVMEASGSDYVAAADEGSKTLTISAGSTSATYAVTTQGDTANEPNGSVTVTVSTSDKYKVGAASSAIVNVHDDDAAPGNNPPRVLELDPGDTSACRVKTSTTTPALTLDVMPGTLLVKALIGGRTEAGAEWPDACRGPGEREAPVFDDKDSTALNIAIDHVVKPDNVKFLHGTPLIEGSRFFYDAFGSGVTQHTVQVYLTATDFSGDSASGFITLVVPPQPGDSKPTFRSNVDGQQFAAGAAITPLVLPEATGGDFIRDHDGVPATPKVDLFAPDTYSYTVSGLPPGLSFDTETRTIWGTPTIGGSYTVTYTAEDADATTGAGDQARQTFTVTVSGNAKNKIDMVRIVSTPSHDADGDGTYDTYILGETILIDVEFSDPVEVNGDGNARLWLDLGSDDTDLTNSRIVLSDYSVLHGGMTVRFSHTVEAGDSDSDGVWVQTTATNGVITEPGTGRVVGAELGLPAVLTKTGLPTSGDANHKVDGKRTNVAGPRPSTATVNGETLTVTFDKALDTSVNTDDLKLAFDVRGTDVDAGNRNVTQHPNRVSVSGTTVTLSLNTPAVAGQTVLLGYRPVDDGVLKDRSAEANKAPPFREFPVTNSTGGTAAPLPLRAYVAETALTLEFDGALNEASTPPGSAFQVIATDPDDSRYIYGEGTATVAGSKVSVTLTEAVHAGEGALVSYRKPESAPLQGAGAENPAVRPFRNFDIRRVYDNTAPKLVNYGAIAGRKVGLYFDEALDETSKPGNSDFKVKVGIPGTVLAAQSVDISDNAIVLTVSGNNNALPESSTIRVTYTVGSNPIKDLAGNLAEGFETKQFTATADTKPTYDSAVLDGARLKVSYTGGHLDPTSVPSASTFTLRHQPYTYKKGDGTTETLAACGETPR